MDLPDVVKQKLGLDWQDFDNRYRYYEAVVQKIDALPEDEWEALPAGLQKWAIDAFSAVNKQQPIPDMPGMPAEAKALPNEPPPPKTPRAKVRKHVARHGQDAGKHSVCGRLLAMMAADPDIEYDDAYQRLVAEFGQQRVDSVKTLKGQYAIVLRVLNACRQAGWTPPASDGQDAADAPAAAGAAGGP